MFFFWLLIFVIIVSRIQKVFLYCVLVVHDCIYQLVNDENQTLPIDRKIGFNFFKTPSSVIGHWLGWAKGEI